MKRILLTLLVLFVIVTPVQIYAQDSEYNAESISESTPSAEPEKPIEEQQYVLPYPGLLPDSPLYFFKAARDNIIGFLISDPLKKAEFNILQADKRLQAGVTLIEKKKNYSLAFTTISKGENYFEEAIGKVREADKQGKDTNAFKSTLLRAAKKHKAVMQDIQKTADKNNKKAVTDLVQRVLKNEEQVIQLASQDKLE